HAGAVRGAGPIDPVPRAGHRAGRVVALILPPQQPGGNTMKIRIALLTGLLAASLSGAAVAAVTAKFAVTLPEKSHQGQGVAKFVELVKAKSNGEIDIKPYYSGALGNDVQVTSALQGGTIEFTVPQTTTLTGMVK